MLDHREIATQLSAHAEGLDAAETARLVRDVPEDVLREALQGPVRAVVVDQVLARLPEYVDPARATDGSVAFAVDGEHFAIHSDAGAVRAERGRPADPRVTLSLDAVDFIRLVTSNADPAMLFLTGRLRLDGDERFAIELASWFRLPGAEREARIDLDAIDPDAIARVVRDTDRRQLERAMSGGARDLVLDQIFDRFPQHVRQDRIAGIDGVLGWKITGAQEPARRRVQFRDGEVLVGDAVDPGARARTTIVCDGVTLLQLVTGNGNPALLFLSRRLRVKGDLGWAAQIPTWFRIPDAA